MQRHVSTGELHAHQDCSRWPLIRLLHDLGPAVWVPRYGNLSDGAILTGFLINEHLFNEVGPEAFGYEFAAESDPDRFANHPSGYIVSSTESNIQQIFLKKGTFEPELLRYAELIKQPNAVAERISGNQAIGRPATDFEGPLQVSEHSCCHMTAVAIAMIHRSVLWSSCSQ